METTIRLKPSELNIEMLDMVKLLAKKKGFTEINISLTNSKPSLSLRKETAKEVKSRVENALREYNSGNNSSLISFSGAEFEQFSKSLQKK